MKTYDIGGLLKENSYPGRGIIIGKSEDSRCAVVAYFIMGRSENSRNRVFVTERDGIKTRAFDPAKLSDPSLIIYSPVKVLNETTIVTNGDQTDTIYDFMKKGETFESALRTREFEPDFPNFTPRISGCINGFGYKLSILKSANADPAFCNRYFYEYSDTAAGTGHFIHTYRCDGDPIPSFEGEPEQIFIDGDIESFSNTLWDNLNPDNKVSLFVRYIDVESGSMQTKIINKNN